MCFGCSKERSLGDGSFEYPHHMFWLRNKKNNFELGALIWGPDIIIVLNKNITCKLSACFLSTYFLQFVMQTCFQDIEN